LNVKLVGASRNQKVNNTTYEYIKVILRVKEQWNILHKIRKRKANWIGHVLRRKFLLQQVIEGKTKMIGGRGRRRRKLLDDLKERKL
jgi:hypothetical protein